MNLIRWEIVLGFIDQALISVMHFSIGIFFIRFAPKESYGLYSIAFVTILFIVGLGNAVITTQMTVNSADHHTERQKDVYCYEMLLAQTMILLPAVFFVMLLIWMLNTLSIIGCETTQYISIITFSGCGVLIHEFFRRFFFLKFNPHLVFSLDILRMVLLIVLIFFFLKTGLYTNFHFMMIAGYGLSAALAGFVGYRIACLPSSSRLIDAKRSFFEAWLNGKWATVGISVTWLQNQSYTYILAALCGTSAIADANAARLFFAPIAILTTSFTRIFMPRLSIMRSMGDLSKIAGLSKKIYIIMFTIVIGYAAIVFCLKDLVIDNVFPEKYKHITPFVIAWMFFFLFQGARANSSLILQVLKKFKYITIYSSFTSVGVILSSVILIHFYGVLGSILGMAAGEMVLAIILWRDFGHVIKKQKN